MRDPPDRPEDAGSIPAKSSEEQNAEHDKVSSEDIYEDASQISRCICYVGLGRGPTTAVESWSAGLYVQ